MDVMAMEWAHGCAVVCNGKDVAIDVSDMEDFGG